MCEYFAIRPADGKALTLSTVSERLLGLGLREDGRLGMWLTGDVTDNMQVNAEADGSGRFAVATGRPTPPGCGPTPTRQRVGSGHGFTRFLNGAQ